MSGPTPQAKDLIAHAARRGPELVEDVGRHALAHDALTPRHRHDDVLGAEEPAPLAAWPNDFLSPEPDDAAAATAGTVNCVLHDVQRIVLPASVSGTSNAA